MKEPKITIVTPSYNQGEFIEETILSVKNQIYPDFDHIILDGGSTDNTIEILKKYENTYNMRWISEKDKGQADAINKGFRMADGDIIGWLNSDDLYFSNDVFSKVASVFEKSPNVDAVYGNRIVIDGNNKLLKLQYSHKFDYHKLLKSYYSLYQETVFLSKKVVEEHQLNTNLNVVMDAEYWLRLGEDHNFEYINDFIGVFRKHTENKTVADSFISQWNKEKQYIIDTYQARRYMIGKGFPCSRFINQIKSILCGGYFEYYHLPLDLIRLASYPKQKLAAQFSMNKSKYFNYLIASVTPWLK